MNETLYKSNSYSYNPSYRESCAANRKRENIIEKLEQQLNMGNFSSSPLNNVVDETSLETAMAMYVYLVTKPPDHWEKWNEFLQINL